MTTYRTVSRWIRPVLHYLPSMDSAMCLRCKYHHATHRPRHPPTVPYLQHQVMFWINFYHLRPVVPIVREFPHQATRSLIWPQIHHCTNHRPCRPRSSQAVPSLKHREMFRILSWINLHPMPPLDPIFREFPYSMTRSVVWPQIHRHLRRQLSLPPITNGNETVLHHKRF